MPKGPSINKIWIILAVALSALAATIFSAYAYYLPKISTDHAAWSSFGSLLSGVFTLAGVLATIATLLFLNAQNKNQQSFIEWQVKTQTFEQYINHRRLFMERMSELQTSNNNYIRFISLETSYNLIFPKNNPTHLDFIVQPEYGTPNRNLLGELGILFDCMNRLLEKDEWDKGQTLELIRALSSISLHLNIEWIKEPVDGDITHDDDYIGVNIYFPEEGVFRLVEIYNSLLFYTGNRPFVANNNVWLTHTRDALMRHFIVRKYPYGGISVHKQAPGLEDFEELYFEIEELRNDSGGRLLPGTYRWLEVVFSDKKGLESICDGTLQDTILNSAMHECTKVLEELKEDDPNHIYLSKLHLRLLNIAGEI